MFELRENPFSREYYLRELTAVSFQPRTYKNITVSLDTFKVGVVHGYMYEDYNGGAFKSVPIFRIGRDTWMSLAPMEIESHYWPIELAEGRVGVAGLGLGYYLQRILAKEEVEEVIMYETNQDVIDLYVQTFGENSKVTFKRDDVRTLRGEEFDFFYNDIYECQMDEQAIEDMALLMSNNQIGDYVFWTLEYFLMEMIVGGYLREIPFLWRSRYVPYFEALSNEETKTMIKRGIGEEYYKLFQRNKIFESIRERAFG